MDQEKINVFVAMNSKYYPTDKFPLLVEKLKNLPEEKYVIVNAIEKKDPTTMLLISIFVGFLGIDRFMIGDTGMGILKLLTGGCCGSMFLSSDFKTSAYIVPRTLYHRAQLPCVRHNACAACSCKRRYKKLFYV